MVSTVILLALAAYVAGLMTSREPLEYFWGKINEGVDILVDAVSDLILAIWAGLRYVAEVVVVVILFILVVWYEVILPALAVICRFIRKWWWVPVFGLLALVFIWGVASMVETATVAPPDAWSLLAFLAATIIAFAFAYALVRFAEAFIWLLAAVIGVVVLLLALGVIGLGLYGLAILFGALIGLLIAVLATVANLAWKTLAVPLLALVVLLTSLIPSCGDSLAIKIPQMGPEAPAEVKKQHEEHVPPYTVTARAVARPGDGCITMLDRLGIAEADAKLLLGTDRLSWCVAKAHEVGRVVYWHSDPKRWMAPKVCMKKVPGKDTQPERWMLVIWPDGSSGIVMPPDSPLCTPRP